MENQTTNINAEAVIQFNRHSESEWLEIDYPLEEGEVGLLLDENGKVIGKKYGNGKSLWRELELIPIGVDQTYDETSNRAQSGKAVAEALDNALSDMGNTLISLDPQFNQTEQAGFMTSNGGYYATGTYNSITTQKIPCKQGDVFVYTGRGSYNAYSWLFYTDNAIVGRGQSEKTVEVVIPENVNYVRFSSCFPNESGKASLQVYKKTDPKTDDLLMFNEEVLDMDTLVPMHNITKVNGFPYLTSNGNSSSVNYKSKVTDKIPCKEGDVFIYKGVSRSSSASWVFYNENSWKGAGQHNIDVLEYQYGGTLTEVVIPEGVNYVKFASTTYVADVQRNIILEVYKKNTKIEKVIYEKIDSINKANVLHNKKWVACGDSFTAGSSTLDKFTEGKFTNKLKVYPFVIGDRNNMEIINLAVSGMTLADNNTDNCFSKSTYLNIPLDADYITIKLGINDANQKLALGEIDDVTNTTFYGAWNLVLENIIVNRPFAKIGIIVPNGIATTNISYVEAIIKIAEKWGVPYLNEATGVLTSTMHRTNKNLPESVANAKMTAFRLTASDTHPNTEAHQFESTIVENFLRSL